jgi:AcrR family transcriptional regulator
MTKNPEKLQQAARILEKDVARSSKHSEKRRDIALHALAALAELGFANVNLREVANRSGITLGSIHYYFHDKTDLLIDAVSFYKDDFIRALEEQIASSTDPLELVRTTNAMTVQAIAEHAMTHRLWYDIRAQALFDPAFQRIVEQLEEGMVTVLQHLLDKLRQFGISQAPTDGLATYVMIDGWFRYYLQRHLAGDKEACSGLARRLDDIFISAGAGD